MTHILLKNPRIILEDVIGDPKENSLNYGIVYEEMSLLPTRL